jgi:hypothetical protein
MSMTAYYSKRDRILSMFSARSQVLPSSSLHVIVAPDLDIGVRDHHCRGFLLVEVWLAGLSLRHALKEKPTRIACAKALQC